MWLRRLIYVGLILTALPALLGALMLFNCINPMMLAFVTRFDVVNQSGEPVRVTPVGTSESGRLIVLPQYALRAPAWPVWHDTDRPIAAGATLTIFYDWDDVGFHEPRVRGADGVERVLPTDPKPTTKYGHRANLRPQYVIPPLATLPPASAPTPQGQGSRMLSLYLIGIAGLILFAWLCRQWLRLRRRPPPLPTQLT